MLKNRMKKSAIDKMKHGVNLIHKDFEIRLDKLLKTKKKFLHQGSDLTCRN